MAALKTGGTADKRTPKPLGAGSLGGARVLKTPTVDTTACRGEAVENNLLSTAQQAAQHACHGLLNKTATVLPLRLHPPLLLLGVPPGALQQVCCLAQLVRQPLHTLDRILASQVPAGRGGQQRRQGIYISLSAARDFFFCS